MIRAKHTIVLKTIMDDSEGSELLKKAMSTYPMYEPQNQTVYTLIPTREQLNKKILNYYKYREIGFETPARFFDELQISLEEIMPYYYQLYKSADIMNAIDDPFGNVDITETFEQEVEGSASGTSKDSSNSTTETEANSTTNSDMTTNSKNVNSKTPQGQLALTKNQIDQVTYADNVDWNEAQSVSTGEATDNSKATTENAANTESSSESSSTTRHTFKKVGNQGVNTYAHDMKELREVFLNIEQQIIRNKRIAELFYLVY